MSEELSVHLSISSTLMIDEMIKLSKGKDIEFTLIGEVIVKDEPRNRVMELHGLSDGKYVFSFYNALLASELSNLKWDRDFDVILNLYKLTMSNKHNTGIKSSNGVMGYRKSG